MTDLDTPQSEKHSSAQTLEQLADQLDGRLVLPSDGDWDAARQAWNLTVDQQPTAVVVAGSVRDVQTVVRTAAATGLRVAPQSSGHNAAPMGPLVDTVLLRMAELREVSVDANRRVARVEAGAIWGEVTPVVVEHGLFALAGSAHDVGVAGYTLGGGVSWLARSHGLAANHVLALEVVTADGEVRRIDPDDDADLFWALRGGGGSFAVVTALELQLFPVTEVCAGALFFPLQRAREVLTTWNRWTADVPDEVMSVGRLVRIPPMPELPPFLSGQSYALVEVVSTLPAEETDALLAPLRALSPVMDTIAVTPVSALEQLHMDPPGPVPGLGDGFLLDALTDDTIDALLAVAGPEVESPILSLELRQLGGALTPGRSEHGGAVDGVPGAVAGYAVGIAPFPEAAAAVHGAVTGVIEALRPWASERCYMNFAETSRTGEALFGAETYARLRQVKATYDPGDVIRSNQPVPPAE